MGYQCTKKGIFCRTESVATTPKSRDYMPTMSLWGVVAKWPIRAPKTKLILCPRDPQGYSCIRSEPARQDFERVPVFHGFCEIALTEVLATQMGVMRRSKKSDCLKCINLIHFRLTAGRLRGSSCIVRPGVVCELLQFAATQ